MSMLPLRILVCASLVGCATPQVSVSPSDREMVLAEGDAITVSPLPHKQSLYPEAGSIPFTGSLQVRAGLGFRRDYTWDGRVGRWISGRGASAGMGASAPITLATAPIGNRIMVSRGAFCRRGRCILIV